MSQLMTLNDALLEQLKDLLSAENQLLKALPKMEKKASNANLKLAMREHLKETEGQVRRLEKISEQMEEKLSGKTCKAMQGLIQEASEILEEDSANAALIDALLIGAARRVEHYEMAAYSTARAMAEALGEEDVMALLQETLDEEMEADEKLSAISQDQVLPAALQDDEDDDDDESDELDLSEDSDDEDVDDEDEALVKGGSASKLSVAKKMAVILALGSVALCGSGARAETKADRVKNENQATEYRADNTGRNARDADSNRVTADDQSLGGKDLQLLATIRKTVTDNATLSTYGKNVKIMVENGNVVLRGPVKTDGEKEWIASTATRLAPNYKVINELEVKAG